MSMTRKRKRKLAKKRSYNFDEPLKIVNTGMKATIGITALGITTTALTNIAKK
jgi:hypothetical protein